MSGIGRLVDSGNYVDVNCDCLHWKIEWCIFKRQHESDRRIEIEPCHMILCAVSQSLYIAFPTTTIRHPSHLAVSHRSQALNCLFDLLVSHILYLLQAESVSIFFSTTPVTV